MAFKPFYFNDDKLGDDLKKTIEKDFDELDKRISSLASDSRKICSNKEFSVLYSKLLTGQISSEEFELAILCSNILHD